MRPLIHHSAWYDVRFSTKMTEEAVSFLSVFQEIWYFPLLNHNVSHYMVTNSMSLVVNIVYSLSDRLGNLGVVSIQVWGGWSQSTFSMKRCHKMLAGCRTFVSKSPPTQSCWWIVTERSIELHSNTGFTYSKWNYQFPDIAANLSGLCIMNTNKFSAKFLEHMITIQT